MLIITSLLVWGVMWLQVNDSRGRDLGQGVVMVEDFQGHEYKSAVIELSTGGCLIGHLLLDVKVKVRRRVKPGSSR